MAKAPQFTLAFIFQEIFLIAVILALLRAWPAWPPFPEYSWDVSRTLNTRWLLGSFAAATSGMLIGNFFHKPVRFAVIALVVAVPVGGVWSFLVFLATCNE